MYILWILIGVIGRLVIHIPDVTPLTSLCLLAPTVFSKRNACFIILTILILSDVSLHFLFNYSGWLFVMLLGFLFAKKSTLTRAFMFTLNASLIFWVWSDFGTWCTSSFYPHTLQGLIDCYIAALPFLRNAIVGSLLWTGMLVFMIRTRYTLTADTINRVSTSPF